MKPALQQYVEEQFGGSFYVKEKSVTVGTTPTLLCDNNFERMEVLFINEGTADIVIKPKSDVATTAGIHLLANGSNASFNALDDLVLPGYSWYGVVASGTQTVYVLEVIRYTEQPSGANQ